MVKLVIKAPNQKIDDCQVMAEMGWTVRQLKDHLSVHYPSRPACTDQRLIYSGHLMRDDQTLQQVFSSSSANEESGNGTVTLHLVCSNSATSSSTTASANNGSRQTPVSSANPASATAGSTAPNTTAAGASMTPAAGSLPLPFPQMAVPLLLQQQQQLVWTPEQLALAQQMLQQFMNQLQANPNSMPLTALTVPSLNTSTGSAAPSPILNPAAAAVPLVNNNNNVQRPLINNNIPHVAPVAAAAPAAPVRQDEDDDDDPEIREERDFLGWFYWLSRAIVLFSVVYFYSSLARLIVVILMAVLMWIYQTGVFVPRPVVDELLPAENEPLMAGNNPQHDQDAGGVNADQAAGAAVQQPDDPAVGNNNNNNNNPARAAAGSSVRRRNSQSDQQVTERNGLRMVWLVVSSLFTSLIPEQPPAHI